MHPLALWAKSVTWGTPLVASSCVCAPFSFLPLLSYLSLLFLHPFAGSLSPCFPVCLFLLSIKAFSSPLSFSPIFFLSTPSFLFFSFFPPPFLLLFHSSSLPLILPISLSFLSPPSVSFIHHFGSIGLEQGARERGSARRQESLSSHHNLTLILYPPPSISTIFFPCWGPGSALGF